MGLIRSLAVSFSKFLQRYTTNIFKDPLHKQEHLFKQLIRRNQNTIFGKRHNFSQIQSIRQ
ncbi:MAG TPA: hypothetical protein VMV49_07750, partial [Candidatus Deferrimicrobium sp.]|nr:hypothetical protein [Candidatus Deferrimicrobium sp.]